MLPAYACGRVPNCLFVVSVASLLLMFVGWIRGSSADVVGEVCLVVSKMEGKCRWG